MISKRLAGKFSLGRKLLSAALGLTTVAVLIVHGLANVKQAHAQSPGSAQTSAEPGLPSFEVASIKPAHSTSSNMRITGPDVSRFSATNVTAAVLIEFAYNVKIFQVSNGPGWLDSDKFDIEAKVEDSQAELLQKLSPDQQQDQTRSMLRSLLADRFRLQVRHELKELPVFALVVAKDGPKLREVPPPDAQLKTTQPPPRTRDAETNAPPLPPGATRMGIGPGGKASMTGNAAPLSALVSLLSRYLDREIEDKTGLSGNYDFALRWTSDTGLSGVHLNPPPPVAPDSAAANDVGGTSIFTAIQEQLGLRLESTKGPVDTIVIEHIEEPTEN